MTPHIANLNTSPRSLRPTVLPSSFRMPHVFVIPPEEEQQNNPPWCCFDAGEQQGDLPSNPDTLLQQSDHEDHVPTIPRTSVHRPRPRAPISKKLEKKQRPEAVEIIENKSHTGGRVAREDSDVVEVVKVKRGREALSDLEENTKLKRSKTFKARATKALRSIKNVGKGSHRTHVKELWVSSESTPGFFKSVQEQVHSQQDQTENHTFTAPAKKGSLSRAASRSLSQIFHPVKRSLPESFTLRVASSAAPIEMRHASLSNSSTPSHLTYNNTNSSFVEVSSTLTIDDALNSSISPSPPTKKRHPNTRFSVRELHRLFTFVSSAPNDPSSASAPTATPIPSPPAPSSSTPLPSTSTLSSYHPNVPMEEEIFADAHFLDLDTPERKLASRYYQASRTDRDDYLSTPGRLSDLSFEMRLNSLHFDSLSFDPEDFDVPTEEVLR